MKFIHPAAIITLAVLVTATASHAQVETIPAMLARVGQSISRTGSIPSGIGPEITKVLNETDIVVRGTIGPPTRTYLSKDQTDIYTDYPLISPIMLFDTAAEASRTPGPAPSITVTILGGGSIQIGGLTFTYKDAALPELPVGSEGLFLLKRVDEHYEPVFHFFGAFEISGDRLVRPFTPKQHFADEYRGEPASATAQSWVAVVAKLRHERK